MKKIGIFVDLSNLYYAAKDRYNGRKPDYAKVYEYCSSFGVVTTAVAYGAQSGHGAQGFYHALSKIGFSLKLKEPKKVGGKVKANCDVDLVVDSIKAVRDLGIDMVVLLTADGDFAPLVSYFREQGCVVMVIGCNISHELHAAANHVVEIPDSMIEAER